MVEVQISDSQDLVKVYVIDALLSLVCHLNEQVLKQKLLY